jgi:hypothetical protein
MASSTGAGENAFWLKLLVNSEQIIHFGNASCGKDNSKPLKNGTCDFPSPFGVYSLLMIDHNSGEALQTDL